MKQLIPTVAWLLLCLPPLTGQYQVIDLVDWTTSGMEDRSGNATSLQPWDALMTGDCDDTGFFGADPTMGVFRIEDTEGTCGCDCIANDPNPLCGQNDNVLNINLLGTPFAHCQTRVRFTIEANGVKCGMNDQYTDAPAGCPGDDSYLGTDLMKIQIVANDLAGVENISICGTNGTGEYIIDLNTSIFVQMQITGGTQEAGEYYTISNIVFEGIPNSLPPTLNATVLTADAQGEICENGLPIILKTIANSAYDFQWVGPDNFFSSDDSPVIQNATPANSGTYYVTVTDPNGCQADHQVSVVVLPANNAKCTTKPTFDNLNVSVCSDQILPNVSDNGIDGTWSPGHVLAPYAGQTLTFTFTPDDPNIGTYSQELYVDDISLLADFGTQAQPVPIFCNTISATYDFIEIFQLNLDMQLQINGENEIFDFIAPGEYLNDHINDLRNLSFGSVTPGIKDFFIEAITPCGEVAIKTFQFIVSSEVDPLLIDTVLCEGEFIEFGGVVFDINNPYGFVDDGFCDSSIVVNLTFKPKKKNPNPLVFSGSCGGDIIYYYDTIVGGEYIGFVGGKISNPPYGPNYADLFTTSFNGNYTMPIPASNGCDSIQRLIISLIEAEFDTIAFNLCSNMDTFINVAGIGAVLVDARKPFQIVGDCDVTIIDATIIQVQADTVQQDFCSDQDTIIDGILFDIDHPKELIFYEVGANGCSASKYVDLTFHEPVYNYIDERICLGDYIEVGGEILSQPVVNYEISLPRQSSSGCDSIIIVNLEVVSPMAEQIEMTLCREENFEFLGEIYDVNRPFGFPKIKSVLGCDSLLYSVNLDFYPADDITLDPVICFGESITFSNYGITIDQNFLQGTIVHTTGDGCSQNIIVNATMLPEVTGNANIDLCTGGSIEINGTVYDASNPDGTEIFLASNGCDSVVSVTLNFLPILESDLNLTICQGGSIDYNGTTYDENNFSGTEMFTTADGCDSLVNVTLTINPVKQSDLNVSICQGGEYIFNGTTYNENNPAGTEFFITTDGCDSLVNVQLTIEPVLESDLNVSICQGAEFVYNGTLYDENNLRGTEMYTTADGCDSLVHVQLTIEPVLESDLNVSICQGGEFVYNGTTYDENNLGGTEMYTTADGCDSLVHVQLTIEPVLESDLNVSICQGGEFVYNGTLYDENNLNGTEMYTTADGCDSLVHVQLTIEPVLESDLNVSLCAGGEFVYNGTIYNENNLSGTEMYTTADGCDSLVHVQLTIEPVLESDLNVSLCTGGEFVYNGTTYDENNLSGTEMYTTADGCDSLVHVQLTIEPVLESDLNVSLCTGGEFVYNGTTYDENNLSGTEMYTTADGCDSLVNVQLTIEPVLESDLNVSLCTGGEFVYNGTTYDENNLSGTEVYTTADGCDSLVHVQLTIEPVKESDLAVSLCTGGAFILNGTTYDENNLSGTEFFTTSEGCDSLVHVSVIIEPLIESEIRQSICMGEQFEYNGVFYDENNPTGSALFQTADGCDSLVNIIVDVQSPVFVEIDTTICPDGFIRVEGQIYRGDVNTQLIVPSALGCDSIIYSINLELLEIFPITLDPVICFGESYTDPVYGVEINAANANTDTTVINEFGCTQPLSLRPVLIDELITDYKPQICRGQSITINGNVYDENNPTGIDVLTSARGCDSTVYIEVIVTDVIQNDITQTLCPGEVVVVNGVTYDENNRQGVEQMVSAKGCDSVVTVSLSYYPTYDVTIAEFLCETESISLNGTIYDVNNPNGVELLQSINGCDSLVRVDLSFSASVTETYDQVICNNETMDIHGLTYDKDFFTDDRAILDANGCDSIIIDVDLVVLEIEEVFNEGILCEDETVTINGVVYDINNPSGTEVITGGAANGCDKIIYVNYTFELSNITDLQLTLCEGESFTLGGVTFDEDMPAGSVTLQSVNGCDSIVDVTLSYYDISIEIGGVIGSCEGVANGAFVINGAPGATPPFYLDGLPGEPVELANFPFEVTGLESGNYTYTVTDANGCAVTGNVSIPNDRSSSVNIEVTTIDPLSTFELNLTASNNIDRIEWVPNRGLSCLDCPNPQVRIEETTTFEVVVYDADGCPASGTVTVAIDEVGNIYIPNIINMSSFAGNEMLYVRGENGVEALVDMIIYDRWGNKVFEQFDAPINQKEYGWDGHYTNNLVNTGVYVYVVKVRIANGAEITLGGDVTVVK